MVGVDRPNDVVVICGSNSTGQHKTDPPSIGRGAEVVASLLYRRGAAGARTGWLWQKQQARVPPDSRSAGPCHNAGSRFFSHGMRSLLISSIATDGSRDCFQTNAFYTQNSQRSQPYRQIREPGSRPEERILLQRLSWERQQVETAKHQECLYPTPNPTYDHPVGRWQSNGAFEG